jgi:hypothetical protein
LIILIILGEEYVFSSTPFSNTRSLCSETMFHTHINPQAKIIVLYTLISVFLDSWREDKRFWTEW